MFSEHVLCAMYLVCLIWLRSASQQSCSIWMNLTSFLGLFAGAREVKHVPQDHIAKI